MAAGVVAGMALLGACAGALYWLLAPEQFPVREVRIRGELKRASAAEIQAALPRVAGNFFSADLAQLRAAAERTPWVRRVSVRRVWPAAIELRVEEHAAMARWGDDRLVNTHGETFSAKTKEALPIFLAPAGTSAEVARRYQRFSEILAPLETVIDRVVLSPRQAWQLRLANGQHLMLGRDADAAEARLRRYVENQPKGRSHEYVDLRYPNGYAVRVLDWSG
jgi:cell division protein FtsQ